VDESVSGSLAKREKLRFPSAIPDDATGTKKSLEYEKFPLDKRADIG
jgi:hypothetical protein